VLKDYLERLYLPMMQHQKKVAAEKKKEKRISKARESRLKV